VEAHLNYLKTKQCNSPWASLAKLAKLAELSGVARFAGKAKPTVLEIQCFLWPI